MQPIDFQQRPETYWNGKGRHQGGGNFMRNSPATPLGLVGEALPELEDEEVEILLIKLRSTLGDVISVRVRMEGEEIRYRIQDEYEWEQELDVPQTTRPLSFQELVDLLRTTCQEDFCETTFLHLSWRDNDHLFLSMESDFYPRIDDWCEMEAETFAIDSGRLPKNWRLYQQTVFLLPDGYQPLLNQETFAIITAANPLGDSGGTDQTEKFLEDLRQRDLEHYPITGCSPDLTHQEESFGVLIPLKDALEFCRTYQQDAIFWVDRDQLKLVDQSGFRETLGRFSERVKNGGGAFFIH